jgi:4-amino-4-deoxy-L-arabinose transferase-like glycosyltransferase
VRALDQTQAIPRQLQWRIALLFFGAVLITRLPTFFVSVLDWDESLYVLMAEQWHAGHLPYTTIWDNKPIGIYGIFLLFQSVFGNPVVAIRAATIAAISGAAFAVFRIAVLIPQRNTENRLGCAVFAGVAFIICSLSNDGLAANTEIFMAMFTAFAVLCALSPAFFSQAPMLRGIVAGSLFGLAFMTKYVAIFEAPAIGFLLLFLMPGTVRERFRACLAAALGFGLPLLATVLLYAVTGHLKLWWECSIASNFLRVATPISGGALSYVLGLQLTRWLPLFAAAAVLLALSPLLVVRVLRTGAVGRTALFDMFLLVWLAGGCIGVAAAKLFYDHYFLQILPVLCVSLALVLARFTDGMSFRAREILFAGILVVPCFGAGVALMGACLPLVAPQDGRTFPHPDTPARIAAAIAHVPAGTPRQVYVFDYQPIIYSLAGQTPPTRYAFPSVLTKCFLSHVAGVRAAAEIHRILAGNPEFIVRSQFPLTGPAVINQAVYNEVNQDIATRYELWRSYTDAAVYRLDDAAPPMAPMPATLMDGCP